MNLLNKSLMVLFVIGIGCFIVTKSLPTPADRLSPDAVNRQSGDPEPVSNLYAVQTADSQNTIPDPSATRGTFSHQTKSNHRFQASPDKQLSERSDHIAEATRVSPVRKSRNFSPVPYHFTGIPTPPASLVWIDGLAPGHDAAIQKLAEEFKQNLQPSSPPSSSADYARSYQEEARLNDIRFQTRYGDQLWMRHHIAAHHLGSGVAPAK